MDIVEILDRYAEGDEFQRPVEAAIEEIEQLRQRVQELEELLKESYKDADEVLRPRVQELEFALAETEALEMSHGERIEKLTAERDELLAALERSLESFEYIAKYGNSCGHSQLRIPDLKAVIASVEGET